MYLPKVSWSFQFTLCTQTHIYFSYKLFDSPTYVVPNLYNLFPSLARARTHTRTHLNVSRAKVNVYFSNRAIIWLLKTWNNSAQDVWSNFMILLWFFFCLFWAWQLQSSSKWSRYKRKNPFCYTHWKKSNENKQWHSFTFLYANILYSSFKSITLPSEK